MHESKAQTTIVLLINKDDASEESLPITIRFDEGHSCKSHIAIYIQLAVYPRQLQNHFMIILFPIIEVFLYVSI